MRVKGMKEQGTQLVFKMHCIHNWNYPSSASLLFLWVSCQSPPHKIHFTSLPPFMPFTFTVLALCFILTTFISASCFNLSLSLHSSLYLASSVPPLSSRASSLSPVTCSHCWCHQGWVLLGWDCWVVLRLDCWVLLGLDCIMLSGLVC